MAILPVFFAGLFITDSFARQTDSGKSRAPRQSVVGSRRSRPTDKADHGKTDGKLRYDETDKSIRRKNLSSAIEPRSSEPRSSKRGSSSKRVLPKPVTAIIGQTPLATVVDKRRTTRVVQLKAAKSRTLITGRSNLKYHDRALMHKPPKRPGKTFSGFDISIGYGSRRRPPIYNPLLLRHRRFFRTFDISHRNRRHFFYYYSLPHMVYYYYWPPYYYSVPYSTYYPVERYYISKDKYQPNDEYDNPGDKTEMSEEVAGINERLSTIAAAFVAGDYDHAAGLAVEAIGEEGDNAVLFFVYSQCLFAQGNYESAAEILRNALNIADIEEQGMFYPMGFYPDEKVLSEQIAKLSDTAEADPFDADLQLLLGYQLLGIGQYDMAAEALEAAEMDNSNENSASLLRIVLEETQK